MSINEIQDRVIEDFSAFDDWMDKYEYLIELGRDLPLINEDKKTNDNLINGCQSRVWVYGEEENGVVKYFADSDAIITKGLISLLIRVLSGHTAKEITETELYFIEKIGLKEHLTPTRSNGLVSMVKQMKQYAVSLL